MDIWENELESSFFFLSVLCVSVLTSRFAQWPAPVKGCNDAPGDTLQLQTGPAPSWGSLPWTDRRDALRFLRHWTRHQDSLGRPPWRGHLLLRLPLG